MLYTTPFLRLAGTGSLGLGLHEHRSTTWYQRCSGKYHYARAVLYPVALLQVVVGTRTMEVRVAIFETLPMDALLGADVPEFPSCCIQTLVLMLWLSWHELRGARYSLRRWALVRRSRSQELPALVWTKSMSGWPAMMISFAKDGPEADNPEFRSMQNDMPMQRTWHKMRTRLWLIYGQKRPRILLTSEQLRTLQSTNITLEAVRWAADRQPRSAGVGFFWRDDLLPLDPAWTWRGDDHRTVGTPNAMSQGSSQGRPRYPIISSSRKREDCSTHLQRFYWPTLYRDVAEYCRTCEVCQKTSQCRPRRVSLSPLLVV